MTKICRHPECTEIARVGNFCDVHLHEASELIPYGLGNVIGGEELDWDEELDLTLEAEIRIAKFMIKKAMQDADENPFIHRSGQIMNAMQTIKELLMANQKLIKDSKDYVRVEHVQQLPAHFGTICFKVLQSFGVANIEEIMDALHDELTKQTDRTITAAQEIEDV